MIGVRAQFVQFIPVLLYKEHIAISKQSIDVGNPVGGSSATVNLSTYISFWPEGGVVDLVKIIQLYINAKAGLRGVEAWGLAVSLGGRGFLAAGRGIGAATKLYCGFFTKRSMFSTRIRYFKKGEHTYDLRPGDHIAYPTEVKKELMHHAIVVVADEASETYAIIHFASDGSSPYIIIKTLLETGLELYRMEYKIPSDNPNKTLERAQSRLNKGGYDVMTNNCEHFASWCRTGKRLCDQVDRVAAVVIPAATLATSSSLMPSFIRQ
ncbi:hypothetical protein CAPTEDRAFT_217253 [Capitella teleta]|uniref:LRAT domain-containing protein n=1 Tax=Capitella teleta TaxID=283909 RepID=R7V403_CAPTE|nr:hypothetical protein CAPTEDRAFT_217253 [Capitella teleta]|eukprot:ELU13583.1 hypothetical protein CAPTEDRAFT_217253 [Capitella teleta]